MPTQTPTTAKIEPTERSSPPEISTTVVPQASTARIEAWPKIDSSVSRLRKGGESRRNTR